MSSFQRKHIRFQPDPNVMAWVSLSLDKFHHDHPALVDTESYKGCGLLFNRDLPLKVGDRCIVKVGELPPMVADLRWRKDFEDGIIRAGFQYQE